MTTNLPISTNPAEVLLTEFRRGSVIIRSRLVEFVALGLGSYDFYSIRPRGV